MSKPTKFGSTQSQHPGVGIPFVVLVGLGGLGLLGYVFGQMVLPVEAHLSHWLVALISAALGGVLGWLWQRRHGDII